MPLEELSRVYGVENVTRNTLSGNLSVYKVINAYESKNVR